MPCLTAQALGASDHPARRAEGQVGPGHSGTLFAETEFLVLVFFHNYISRWDFSSGKRWEGEHHGSVPARSERELTLGSACPPAIMIF